MLGLLIFILGIVLGIVVNPWCFLLCALPILATIIYRD